MLPNVLAVLKFRFGVPRRRRFDGRRRFVRQFEGAFVAGLSGGRRFRLSAISRLGLLIVFAVAMATSTTLALTLERVAYPMIDGAAPLPAVALLTRVAGLGARSG